jgi:hypothetical protein
MQLIIFTGRSINYFNLFVERKGADARLALPASIHSALQLAAKLSRPEIGKCVRFWTLILDLKCLYDVCLECMQVILPKWMAERTWLIAHSKCTCVAEYPSTCAPWGITRPVSGERNWRGAIGRFVDLRVCGWHSDVERLEGGTANFDLAKEKKRRGDGTCVAPRCVLHISSRNCTYISRTANNNKYRHPYLFCLPPPLRKPWTQRMQRYCRTIVCTNL